jgi:hypothetical protein
MQRPVETFGVAQNGSLNQQKTEKTMLVQDKLQETKETTTEETSALGSPTPAGLPAADVQSAARSARPRWPLVSLLASTAALVGVVALVTVTQSDQDAADPGRVSDGSFEEAEVNRMETLRDLATGS